MTSEINKMQLSIVLCTYNNADSLNKTLSQLSKQKYNSDQIVEIIIVDNNSTDDTSTVIDFYSKSNPCFLKVFEPKQGLSYARNAGIKQSTGEYILFTDDDAELPPNWINAYLNIINAWNPDCCYSKITVIWDNPKPWWYCNKFGAFFVELDHGNSVKQIQDNYHEFFGKNFCVKKSEIVNMGGFDPQLGRIGNKLGVGEETILYRKLVSTKKKIFYFPDAGVGHRLKDKEYTEEHITKLFIDGAYSAYHLAYLTSNKKILNRPLGILVRSIKAIITIPSVMIYYMLERKRVLYFYHKLILKKNIKLLRIWLQPYR
jgi:glucosyl-dolichyl phosphate glucuronosyltransferase